MVTYAPPGLTLEDSSSRPTDYMCVFWMDLRTNSVYFLVQH